MAKGFKSSASLANALQRDLQDEITRDFNDLVAATVSDLASEEVSPVLTGFFASSWKASSSPIRPREYRENNSPWAGIKYSHGPNPRLLPGFKAIIEPRHTVRDTFRLNQTVFIGNTAKYAPYAVVSPKARIINYLQGPDGLNAMIDTFMSDKKTDIRVGDRQKATNFNTKQISFTRYPT